MIVKRAETLGVDWTGTMAKLQAQDWSSRIKVCMRCSQPTSVDWLRVWM